MSRRSILNGVAALAPLGLPVSAWSQDTVKIGLVHSITGGIAPVRKQIMAGIRLYMQQHGDTVAGKKTEIVLRDDATIPDVAKRLA